VKVLALLGSPRRDGNTDIMAEEVLRGAREAGADTKSIAVDDKSRALSPWCSNVAPSRAHYIVARAFSRVYRRH
jgi:multimeric flavodoxin WrbA